MVPPAFHFSITSFDGRFKKFCNFQRPACDLIILKDMQIHLVLLCEVSKYGPEITPYLDTFHVVASPLASFNLKSSTK